MRGRRLERQAGGRERWPAERAACAPSRSHIHAHEAQACILGPGSKEQAESRAHVCAVSIEASRWRILFPTHHVTIDPRFWTLLLACRWAGRASSRASLPPACCGDRREREGGSVPPGPPGVGGTCTCSVFSALPARTPGPQEEPGLMLRASR